MPKVEICPSKFIACEEKRVFELCPNTLFALRNLHFCEAGVVAVGAGRHLVPISQSYVKAAFGAAVFALAGLFTGIDGMSHYVHLL